ncbi:MAG: hypothetical protein LBT59_15700 [Clostridiales bacterium]|jgi:hypothetical protein|nr:hypothetical protein [Clostridiales bacterium]
MPYNITLAADKYVSLSGRLTENEIEELAAIGAMDRIEASFVPLPDDLAMLNELYFQKFPSTGLRLSGLASKNTIDLKNLSSLTYLQKLSLDGEQNVVGTEALTQLPRLKKLALNIKPLCEFNFLRNVSNGLEQLSLETKSKSLDLSILKHFKNLRAINLSIFRKGIEALCDLPLLESLTFKGSPSSFDFLNKMPKLKRLRILRGSARDFSEIYGNKTIKVLQLVRIPHLDQINLISNLPNLETLELSQLCHITELPNLSGHNSLKHVLLEDLKSLTDLSGLEHCPNLETFDFSMCPISLPLDSLVPVLRNKHLQHCSVSTASANKNQLFSLIIDSSRKKSESGCANVRKAITNDFGDF